MGVDFLVGWRTRVVIVEFATRFSTRRRVRIAAFGRWSERVSGILGLILSILSF